MADAEDRANVGQATDVARRDDHAAKAGAETAAAPAASPAPGLPAGGAPGIGLPALVGLVTGVQGLATFGVLALPTLATKAAPDFGLGPEAVGYQISVIYLAAASFSSVAGLFVRRYGAASVSLLALAFCGLGLIGIATGSLAVAVIGSLSLGCAYGLTNPAASHLLLRFAPRQHQNLIFALKQSGVPLGGILAALMLPSLSERTGWRTALLLSVALLIALAIPLALARKRLDADRDPGARLGSGGLMQGVRLVTVHPVLRPLAIMGFAYASFQFCLFTFLITMLVKDFGWSLVAAGGLATFMQTGGALGRIAWSVLADRIGHGLWVLVVIGVASSVLALGLAFAGPSWPVWALSALLLAFGFCLVGWNGLWMAEIARTAGQANVGLATGGVLVFTYAGVTLGPATFALVYRWLGSYAATYGAFAVLTLIGAAALIAAIRHRAKATQI